MLGRGGGFEVETNKDIVAVKYKSFLFKLYLRFCFVAGLMICYAGGLIGFMADESGHLEVSALNSPAQSDSSGLTKLNRTRRSVGTEHVHRHAAQVYQRLVFARALKALARAKGHWFHSFKRRILLTQQLC